MARTIVYSRFVFNRFFAMRKHTYKEMEKTLTYHSCSAGFPQ
ncbi:helix-turn-helix domain-containing protein [Bacillus cereus]|nr:helix-turn-helix domain-containing protein [Bacillus cereus]